MEKPAEVSARIKSVLDSIAQRREELEKVNSDQLRLTIIKEKAEKAMDSLRIQLLAELKKFDPTLELCTTNELEESSRG